ncbi:hypothetical protein BRD00_12450 [Halobacteriales archaeon QS_8_69_26]|nr:MAG: hypothetical protein BRD00_12450 [Halobacteriales archaeon QS_8_69_26]
MTSPFASDVIADMREIREEGLSRDQFTEISRVVARDCRRFGDADRLYFVVGNYDEGRGQRDRVAATRDRISGFRSDTEAFLLEEVDPDDEAWENWYVKFRVFLRRATWVVGVFEDNDGGHELEAGEVDTGDLYVLKRDYYTREGDPDVETEHDRFDGMLAKYFAFLENRDRLYRWTTADVENVDGLETATDRLLNDTVLDGD